MVNEKLASEKGLSWTEIRIISLIHEVLKNKVDNACKEGYCEETFKYIENCEYFLQTMWGFPQDGSKHTWKRQYWMKAIWAGRTFRCADTGMVFTIPDNVQERDFFPFGMSFVDVGDCWGYVRMGGSAEEIVEEESESAD